MTQIVDMGKAVHDALVGEDMGVPTVIDDTSLLHVPGMSGLGGDYQGRDAIVGLFERMAQLTGRTLRFRPSRALIAGEQAIVVCGRSTARRQGRHLDTGVVHVLSLRGGIVRDIWVFHQNQDQVDRFWTGDA
jgi:ketosteroid isomerase-like protein